MTIAAEYDEVPYTGTPHPLTHPARFGAIALMCGVPAPALSGARVLEIGCAEGANLIPLAAEFPNTQFFGIDISRVQIDTASNRSNRLKLKSVGFLCSSLEQPFLDDTQFEYIICHGVYSWISPGARAVIWSRIARLLSPPGIVHVSFNVLPGFNFRVGLLRAVLQTVIPRKLSPREGIRSAREWLARFSDYVGEGDRYRAHLKQLSDEIAAFPDYYLYHEYLCDYNQAFTIHSVASKALVHGLHYFGDVDAQQTIVERSASWERERPLIEIASELDAQLGITFRHALFSKAANVRIGNIQARFHEAAKCLHFVAGRAPDAIAATTTSGSASNIDHLRSISLTSLPISPEDNHLLATLWQMLKSGKDLIARSEPTVPKAPQTERPTASFLARQDAADHRGFTTNARHEPSPLDYFGQTAIPLMDGTRSFDDLVTSLTGFVREGQLRFQRQGEDLLKQDAIDAAIREHLRRLLDRLETEGLLNITPP